MIKVKLNDGKKVKVGGDFQRALEMIKAIPGRKYDGQEKTWTVPMDLGEFCSKASFYSLPIDIIEGDGESQRLASGNHITSYGNAASSEEWRAQKDVWAAEKRITNEHADAIEAPKQWFVSEMVAIGIPEQAAKSVLGLIQIHDLEYQIGIGKIQFSSQEREQQVRALVAEYWKRQMAAYEAEEAALDSARTRIWEGAGIL